MLHWPPVRMRKGRQEMKNLTGGVDDAAAFDAVDVLGASLSRASQASQIGVLLASW